LCLEFSLSQLQHIHEPLNAELVDAVTTELADTATWPGGCGGLAFDIAPTSELADTTTLPGGCGGLAFNVAPG
jgi:hypothetical protein